MEATRAHRLTISATSVAVIVAVLFAGCASNERRQHGEGDGPLSGYRLDSGISIDQPDQSPWSGSFGNTLLCTTEPGTHIELEGVRFDTSDHAPPLETTALLRTDYAMSFLMGPGLADEDELLFNDPDMDDGTYTDQIAGTVITESCDLKGDDLKRIPELVIIVKAGDNGAQLDATLIDYLADGKPRTLEVAVTMILCGDSITDDQMCQPG